MYPSGYPPARESALAAWLHTSSYRAFLLGALVFCAVVTGAFWLLHNASPLRRTRYAIPPGQAYHVRSSGEMVPVGGADPAATPAPAAPLATHANLLDHLYHITSEFGHYPNGGAHYGLDLDAWSGTVLHAPVGGVVTEAYSGCTVGDMGCGNGWGDHVWFKSAETSHYILVAHFQKLADWVHQGVTFDAGAPFGESGSTGFSSGPHVHLQVNPDQMGNAGSTNPAWEFPWLHCTEPVLGAFFGATCP